MICCPYCLEIVNPKFEVKGHRQVYVCSNPDCKRELPRDLKESPWRVGLVGFTGHGKTVYLTSLFYTLKVLRREKTWDETFSWLGLDENTHKIMYRHVPLFEQSKLPASTPENFPEPALIQFTNIPLFKNCFLSFYDTAGRVYEDIERITEMGRFVARSTVVFFIVSLRDCGENWGETMESLIETYINAVYNKLNLDLKREQHLIVVLTKADLLEELPQELKRFLLEGLYKWYSLEGSNDKTLIRSKLKELRRVSLALKRWLESKGCGGFTRLAAQRFRSVEYTIVSSTGAAPVGDMLATKLDPEDPKRVLDPFLWALEKNRKKGLWEKLFGG